MQIARTIDATPERVFAALVDPALLAQWLAPEGMRGEVHEYDARVGGRIRMSLTYHDATMRGKTEGATDTWRGRVLALEPPRRVVWAVEFEATDAATAGEMRVAWTIEPMGSGSRLLVAFDGLPSGIDPEQNAEGSRQSLAKLASLLERRQH